MKLVIKIFLFVFVSLITNVNIVSAAIARPNIHETTTSFSFKKKYREMISKSLKMIWQIVVKMSRI